MEHRRHQKGLEGRASIPGEGVALLVTCSGHKPPPGRNGTTGIKRTLPQALGQLQPHLAHCLLFANKVLLTAVPVCVRVSSGCSCHMAAECGSHDGDPLACRAGDISCCAHQPRQHGVPIVPGAGAAHASVASPSAWCPRRPWAGAAHVSVASPTALCLCCSVAQSRLPLLRPHGL